MFDDVWIGSTVLVWAKIEKKEHKSNTSRFLNINNLQPMVLVKGSLPAASTNERSEKIIWKRSKYKMKILNPNISKNLNKNNGQPMVLVKGSLPTTSTNDRSEKIIGKRKKYIIKI